MKWQTIQENLVNGVVPIVIQMPLSSALNAGAIAGQGMSLIGRALRQSYSVGSSLQRQRTGQSFRSDIHEMEARSWSDFSKMVTELQSTVARLRIWMNFSTPSPLIYLGDEDGVSPTELASAFNELCYIARDAAINASYHKTVWKR